MTRPALVPADGGTGKFTPGADLGLHLLAAVLMLVGAVLIFTGPSAGLAFSLIGVGAALTAILETEKRRHKNRQ